MSPRRSRPPLVGLLGALLCAALALFSPEAAAAPTPSGPTPAAAAATAAPASALATRPLSSLPPEAAQTHRLIRAGGPFPYSQDGTTFRNREGLLPVRSSGYYREYTVDTPGLDHRGARRIVTGSGGEVYYTDDHYGSFVVVDVTR